MIDFIYTSVSSHSSEVIELFWIMLLCSFVYGLISGITRFSGKSLVVEVVHVGLFLGVCALSRAIHPGVTDIIIVAVAVVVGIVAGRVAGRSSHPPRT